MVNSSPISLDQLFRYNRNLPHQLAAIKYLEEDLKLHGYEVAMRRDRPWFATWSQDGKQEDVPLQQNANPLPVPYEYQLDNVSGTGYRECFSSSCAMIARFYGKVRNDDEYNRIRAKFGDSTNSAAQLKALDSLGLHAKFITNGSPALLEKEIDAGHPVAVGWLHHGPYNHPSGGGHYSVVIGYTKDAFIHNDPNGEADLINGGYANHTNGKAIAYSRQRWLRRWEADGNGSGWALICKP